MKVTLAKFTQFNAPGGVSVVGLSIGNEDTVLSMSIALDSKCRHFDSALIADMLREIAEKLEKEG